MADHKQHFTQIRARSLLSSIFHDDSTTYPLLRAHLRAGLGENWEQQVAMTEQIYLTLKQQMGGGLNCGAIEGLAGR